MKNKKILLAEDDPFIIDIYTTKLKQAGFEVVVVDDGEEVLKRIKAEKPDLLLLDIVLPGMNGWEILEAIHKSDDKSGELKNLPVIILSNLYQKEEVERGLKFGVERYLIKAHHTPAEVVAEVKKILSL